MTIVMAVLLIGVGSGLILAIISPLTAFWIAPSPITMGIPFIIPCIMVGNVLLVMGIWLFQDKFFKKQMKENARVALGMLIGVIAKAVFMGVSIALVLLPMYSSNIKVPAKKLTILMSTAKITFSITQLITAATGCVICYVVWLRMKGVVTKGRTHE
ncbi:conserved hypothetical protein [Lachnospiraceae bacterium KM106-2]|nr:conserved hypothetical protein [Lachnospiraceae bacterium KM106-2]